MNSMLKKITLKLYLILFFMFSPILIADMALFSIIPILGYYSNYGIFHEFNVGFGGSSNFPFASTETGKKIWVSTEDLILNDNISDNSYYANIKNFNGGSFQTLQAHLKKSKFFTIWITKGWEDNWFNLTKIQNLMDAGYIPVFNYWYFGDGLSAGLPDAQKVADYKIDAQRVGNMLGQLNGTKMLIMEPEFNKGSVMKNVSTQQTFAGLMITAINIIRAQNPNKLLVSLCMTDQGRRSVYSGGCGYTHCALGDTSEWSKLNAIYSTMLPHLDFLSFYQIVGQFSRDYDNPGSWNQPNPRSYSAEEQGIDYLPDRILNLTKFLHDTYKKPVYMPYISVPTATWSDSNRNGQLENYEVNPNGWIDKANNTYLRLSQLRPALQASGLFGFATMELFDNPRHDYGGYQYLMNNTYHLGIIGSSAVDETDIAAYGDLSFKGTMLNSIFN